MHPSEAWTAESIEGFHQNGRQAPMFYILLANCVSFGKYGFQCIKKCVGHIGDEWDIIWPLSKILEMCIWCVDRRKQRSYSSKLIWRAIWEPMIYIFRKLSFSEKYKLWWIIKMLIAIKALWCFFTPIEVVNVHFGHKKSI